MSKQLALNISDRPSHRAGAQIKANVVIVFNISKLQNSPYLCYSKHVLITSQDDTASQNTALPKMPFGRRVGGILTCLRPSVEGLFRSWVNHTLSFGHIIRDFDANR